jgi:hypothetical protein
MTPVAPVLAHETWFTHGEHPLDWSFAGETTTLALLARAVPWPRLRRPRLVPPLTPRARSST